MSVKIMTSVWDASRQTGTHLLMLLALADHANDAGQCWPMIERLAVKCRVTRRQAKYILNALEDAGEIVIERGQGRGHPSVYTVKGATDCPFYDEKGEKGQPTAPFTKKRGNRLPLLEKEKGQSSVSFLLNKEEPSLKTKTRTRKEFKPPAPPSSSSSTEEPVVAAAATEDTVVLETITTPEAFIQLFNANIPAGISQAKTLSKARRKRIEEALADNADRMFWLTCFRAPITSAFLRGERAKPGHERFKFDIDFLLRKGKDGLENCVKVYEGKYADTEAIPDTPKEIDPLAGLSPRTQETIRQAQRGLERMRQNPRWNPALRKAPDADL